MALTDRYAINDTSADWGMAESHVSKLAKGGRGATVVSVKSTGPSAGQKRKAEAGEGKGKQGAKKGKKTKH